MTSDTNQVQDEPPSRVIRRLSSPSSRLYRVSRQEMSAKGSISFNFVEVKICIHSYIVTFEPRNRVL